MRLKLGLKQMSDSTYQSNMLRVDVPRLRTGEVGDSLDAVPQLALITPGQRADLATYLRARIAQGIAGRDRRIPRYRGIDLLISTWLAYDENDSMRVKLEETTGKSFALPFNLPVLATHLTDMTSYFADALAPVSNPFADSSGSQELSALTDRLNRDARARKYYSNVTMMIRSLLKYNIGGLHVEWDEGSSGAVGLSGVKSPGNVWTHLPMHNTFWDTTLTDPSELPYRGEYGGFVRLTNRVEIARRALAGEWINVRRLLGESVADDSGVMPIDDDPEVDGSITQLRIWRDPAASIPTQDGRDAVMSSVVEGMITEEQWESVGLGGLGAEGLTGDAYELTTIYCWLTPDRFGLLSSAVMESLIANGTEPSRVLELWKFEVLNGNRIVSAKPVLDQELAASGEVALIPMFIGYMIQDHTGGSQRSTMELMRGFQRYASSMFAIHQAGMRKSVWGTRIYDPSMVDASSLRGGEVAALLATKTPGRDVRTAIANVDATADVSGAMQAVNSAIGLKDSMFPSQALPSQIAGMDRAVTNQVTQVVQGAQRGLRMLLQELDATLLLPSRMEAVRNVQRYDTEVRDTFANVSDEDVAKALGSGIESMEAARIVDYFWQILNAAMQNPLTAQQYNLPMMYSYLGRLMNLSVDLGTFVKPEPPVQPQAGVESGAGTEQQL